MLLVVLDGFRVDLRKFKMIYGGLTLFLHVFSRFSSVSKANGRLFEWISEELSAVTGAKAVLVGSGLNSKGQSSSLASPSGPAIKDVVARATRSA